MNSECADMTSVCVCVCLCVGVNSFILSLSDDSVSGDVCLYEALQHCRQLGALAVINADSHPSFTALVSPALSLLLFILFIINLSV